MINRALFLDRDGVVNVNHGYVYQCSNFEFIPGIFELVAGANVLGFKVVVVTNQSGIARGMYTEADFHALTGWMCNEFGDRDATIDRVYFSPFHPTAGLGRYKQDSPCRKPSPGMLLWAIEALVLDVSRSVMVGDNQSDIQAGRAAGVAHNWLFGPGGDIESHAETLLRLNQCAEQMA